MVVPEFPQSISSFGGVSTRFFPWTERVVGSGCSILIPKARRAFTVRMQSSLGRKPRRVHGLLDSAAIITARWEMLLSPGTVISVSIRGARLTRNSIDQFEKDSPEALSRVAFHSPNRHQHPRLDAVVHFSPIGQK